MFTIILGKTIRMFSDFKKLSVKGKKMLTELNAVHGARC